MSAPIDQDSNTVSFYAPTRRRAIRLAQVSEAATALEAVRGGLGGDENGTSRALLTDLLEGDAAIERQRLRPARALDPELVPAPPSLLRSRSWLGVCLVVAMLAIAVIAFIATGRSSLFPTTSRQQASDRTFDLASLSGRPAAGSREGIETEIPQLVGQGSRGMSGESAPLGVTLQGRADGAGVPLTGLAAGMTSSTASDVGAQAWQVPATDAVLSNTWIVPPKDFIGVADHLTVQLADTTIAHRWPIDLGLAAATPTVAAPTPAIEAQRVTVAPPRLPTPPHRELDREEIAILVKRGRDFIASGDPAGARVVLQRAAESKDAEAALMLAATYDPVVLRQLKVYGLAADVAMARVWYEKAKEFGSAEAPRRLEILASATR
jgi:hypothetical protein